MTRSRSDQGTLVEWQGVNLPLHFTPHFARLFLQVLLVLIFTPGQRKVLKGKIVSSQKIVLVIRNQN